MLIWLCVILIGCIVIAGCIATHQQIDTPQPTFYSPTEKHIMYIPKGCKIGDIIAPEDGIFIGRSRILDMRIVEVPEEKKQDKKYM